MSEKSNVFSKVTAYVGLVFGALSLVPASAGRGDSSLGCASPEARVSTSALSRGRLGEES
jgi:hypothetical protein